MLDLHLQWRRSSSSAISRCSSPPATHSPPPSWFQSRCGVGGGEEVAKALKIIWDCIKQHNLKDPANEKIIACDEKLKKLFGGKEHVGFLEIPRLLDPHFAK